MFKKTAHRGFLWVMLTRWITFQESSCNLTPSVSVQAIRGVAGFRPIAVKLRRGVRREGHTCGDRQEDGCPMTHGGHDDDGCPMTHGGHAPPLFGHPRRSLAGIHPKTAQDGCPIKNVGHDGGGYGCPMTHVGHDDDGGPITPLRVCGRVETD